MMTKFKVGDKVIMKDVNNTYDKVLRGMFIVSFVDFDLLENYHHMKIISQVDYKEYLTYSTFWKKINDNVIFI